MTSRDGVPLCLPCPICQGTMEVVYERPNQQVCVCVDCHSGITIPVSAWAVQKSKLAGQAGRSKSEQ